MSAITGIYNLNREPVSPEQSSGIMKALEKYPANDARTLHKDNLFLGCHAQWITPESINEFLPFYDYERQLAITADAIIDNREELFNKLQVKPSNQKSITDSELILLTYEKWGEDAPKFLIGDFAFMLWDEKERKLFGARDFSGARTLYYYNDERRFAFCTVIEPLFTLPYVEKKLNEQWLAEFLAIPGMNDAVDTSITVHKHINQLQPSHTITVFEGGVRLSKYCTLTAGKRLKLKSDSEYEEAFREVFHSAVNARLRTNRLVGAHLSGGLDSGSVVSFAAKSLQQDNKRLHTFSYVPPNDFIDWTPKNLVANERPFIESTVKYVGNITDHYLSFEGASPLSAVNDFLETMEMPYKFFGNSIWLKGIFEKSHEQGIGVLLNGGRGNLSISWGPTLNYYAILLKRLKWIRLYYELNQYSKNVGGNRLRLLPAIGKIAFPFISRVFSSDEPNPFPMLINPELAQRTCVFEKLKDHGIKVMESSCEEDVYDARRKHFEEVYPWNTTGTLGTKLSLRYSLWKRDPTNDIRVIRFCLSVPEEQYVQNGLDRALIRRATKNYVPDKVRLNQRVRGIQAVDTVHRMAPFWNRFIGELEQISRDPLAAELINMQVVKSAISKIKQGPRPEFSLDLDFYILVRSLIVYRFIRKFT